MSLRRLYVLISNLPPESHVWAITNGLPYGWTPQVAMTADLYHAFVGEPHPATPKPKKATSRDADALAARLKAQRERIAAQRAAAPPPSS